MNGSDRLNVVLDTGTGASLNILSPEWASKLNLTFVRGIKAGGLGKGQDETVHLVSNVHLSWGIDKPLALNDQHMGVLPVAHISRQTGLSGRWNLWEQPVRSI